VSDFLTDIENNNFCLDCTPLNIPEFICKSGKHTGSQQGLIKKLGIQDSGTKNTEILEDCITYHSRVSSVECDCGKMKVLCQSYLKGNSHYMTVIRETRIENTSSLDKKIEPKSEEKPLEETPISNNNLNNKNEE
jgi:hypothetical protein